MPSDETANRIFAMLAPAVSVFRSAVTDAAEALRGQLDAQRPANGRAQRVAQELGAFAAGRIDVDRFAELLDHQRTTLDERAVALLERARAELAAIAAAGDAPFRVRVPAGGDLAAEVGAALAVAGRAYCAARVAELVRMGRTKEAAQEDFVAGLPFARWTRGELRIAPPLLVEADGGDLQAGALAAFLDGAQKIVIIARSPAPPAALVRLITPGVFVMQTGEPADLERLAAIDGRPGIAALVPAECATFVHDPAGGALLAARLTVHSLPDAQPAARLGRSSAFQQAEELALLRTLADAARPAPAPVAIEAATAQPVGTVEAPAAAQPAAVETADLLGAWLLQQADLTGIA